MKGKRTKKELIAVCLLVLSLVLITVGTTFALYQYVGRGTTENKIQTGNLTFVYDESKSKDGGVSLTNAFPMSDEVGEALTSEQDGVFDFDVRAKTQGAPIHYEIYLTKVAPQEEEQELPENVVKTYLTTLDEAGEDQEDGLDVDGLPTETNLNLYSDLWDSAVPSILENEEITNAKTLYREMIEAGQDNYQKHFRYRMWIDNGANQVVDGSWIYNNKSFSVKVNVYAQNEEIGEPTEPQGETQDDDSYANPQDTSGASVPKLVTGMIPVVYNDVDQRWEKAGTSGWYDYDQQKWANAVTVVATTTSPKGHNRSYYQQAEAGTPILMEDINTMWVWIPRYEYDYQALQKLGSTPGEIDIKFIDTTKTSLTETDNYKVHPAFDFGEEQLDGFWYGKFETSSKEQCTATSNVVNTACDKDNFTPQIQPGVTSWRGIRVSTAFTVSQKMVIDYANEYGFTGNEIDTHMSKNSEWGAVAYLSQSKYGKYHVDQQEVYINSCSNWITGIAGATASAEQDSACTNTYNTEAGQKASTTGNITGVYDMSGGAEYVMGALDDRNGKPRSGYNTSQNSGFNGVLNNGGPVSDGRTLPNEKYYDLYSGNAAATACGGGVCYGHALSETAGWYSDYDTFVTSSYSWFVRGGRYDSGSGAGVFSFDGYYGHAYGYYSFRLVLVSTGA